MFGDFLMGLLEKVSVAGSQFFAYPAYLAGGCKNLAGGRHKKTRSSGGSLEKFSGSGD